MKDYYGNIEPNNSSAHFLLHMTAADVLATKYPNHELMNEQMIMGFMIDIGRTAGRKGNIYTDDVLLKVILTIEHYLKFHKTTKNVIKTDDEMLSRSYEHKIRAELIASGMEYDENTNEVLIE
ncbi:unnamed protein product [Rotaria sp. Silwood1]|nr:unnamed protein product [Rotaria sp. Silwood1]CAF1154388.1 unnamed protein product [Rotaria sp. Silwood1]CAF1342491.1 unnamed protein product [Rotaria sp. Silwood1]CAF3441986.1 unnamed protein product [Rotaria sp. Silwood1]CAF3844489.1 unnamed protein product [Rotaria sp. Silwood1]